MEKYVSADKETFDKFIQQYPRNLNSHWVYFCTPEMCMYLDNMKNWEGHEDYCGAYPVAYIKETFNGEPREYLIDHEAMERYPVHKGEVERKQLFRGLGFNSFKWRYGGILFAHDTYIMQPDERDGQDATNFIQIYPNTIGEYIGMKDCNGSEIFEGDILKISDSEESRVGIVTYSFASWCIKNGHGKLSICDVLKINMKGANYIFEVIGNIHENSELLASLD